MFELKVRKRELKLSSKQLRRQGMVPAVLYGKHLEESIPVEVSSADLASFMKSNSVGSKLNLIIGRKKYMALLKAYTTVPLSPEVEHLSFQALTASEKVTSSAHIAVHNRENVRGVVQHLLDEISFKALPEDLTDRIDVDIADMKIGDIITVADLPIASNKAVEILTPLDTVVVSVSAPKEHIEEGSASEEDTDQSTGQDQVDEEAGSV